ncbi:MAG TPA: sigma 54-interacting transcriptional regulator, partial [Fibrobacteraceae bacterium]|nr:sigma 54-interacting transcriptional regulator [Fibrobacteraceae bacterium]
RKGLVEQADEGTLFLDEIGDLAPESQIKLLRLIQEGEFYPIGAERPRKVRLWVVTATNRPIGSMPNFRKDLFYRLQSHWIELPPLRERQGDVGLLLNSFLENAAQILNRECPADFGTRLELRLRGYGFPGNIRELQGLVFDVLGSAGTDGSINEDVLRRWINLSETVEEAVAVDRDPINFVRFGASLPTMRELEHLLIEEALSRTNQNQTATATLLGISRQTLLNHKKRANI